MNNKTTLWIGRILTGLTGFFLFTGGINMIFIRSADLREAMTKFGYPESALTGMGIAVLISALLYLIPQTAILGAVLLTGYLGGAVSTHVRAADGMAFAPVIFGGLVWLGIFLREPRLRALLPLVQPRA
jgi:DoxX-like family